VTLAIKDNIEPFPSAAKYVEEIVNQHKSNNPNFQPANGSTTLGTNPAEKLVYESMGNGNQLTKNINIVTMKDNEIYLFLFSSSPTNYIKYLPFVEQMRKSLTMK